MVRTQFVAVDGQRYRFVSKGNAFLQSWHSPANEPPGVNFGSAAICVTATGDCVVGSAGGKHGWEVPGGRPEAGEDWRTTLNREVLEEACARIDAAQLLGFARTECVSGPEHGKVLVRSLWLAQVTLLPWNPLHEIRIRRIVPITSLLDVLEIPQGQSPIYWRWREESKRALAK